MALGLQTEAGSGNFEARPYVKYDSKAGRMFSVDRVQGPEGWQNQTTDITNGFAAVFDMANVEVGWIAFTAQGPNLALVPLGQPLPAKPGADHKQGFRLNVYSKALGAREFSATAKAVLGSIDALHTAYEAAPESKQGLLPVVRLDGVDVVETQGPKGTNRNYAPKLSIAQWVPRPAALAPKPTASAAPPAQQTSAKPMAAPVAPPPPVAAAAPEPALDPNNFG
jgi:hypothetical protein